MAIQFRQLVCFQQHLTPAILPSLKLESTKLVAAYKSQLRYVPFSFAAFSSFHVNTLKNTSCYAYRHFKLTLLLS